MGAGALMTAVAADPISPPAVANDAEAADAPEIGTLKRKRASGDEGTRRDATTTTRRRRVATETVRSRRSREDVETERLRLRTERGLRED